MPEFQYPWYDSGWLACFDAAIAYIRAHLPDRIGEFEAAFETLKTDPNFDTILLDRCIDESMRRELCDLVDAIPDAQLQKYEMFGFGRTLLHNQPRLTELQHEWTDRVASLVGEAVEPSYNFLSLYNNLGVCPPHMDSPEAKWTLDICLRHSAVWPILIGPVRSWPTKREYDPLGWQEQIKGGEQFTEVRLAPGQAALFSGSSQWHYRERIPQVAKQNFVHLLFLHYIPVNCRMIANPHRWSDHFGIPALAEIREIAGYENGT